MTGGPVDQCLAKMNDYVLFDSHESHLSLSKRNIVALKRWGGGHFFVTIPKSKCKNRDKMLFFW